MSLPDFSLRIPLGTFSILHLIGLENSETPSTSTVWPSDHREDYMSCAWPFYILVQIIPYKRCANKAVGAIWRALSKPPKRRQGPDPRPLWLLVGTPSAFGPELAYRLRVAQPTLMDVLIFLIYFYITIYVCVPHFYDLSALVGCWSSVSIRRIIFKCFIVWPFDYTAVAISGKVERS